MLRSRFQDSVGGTDVHYSLCNRSSRENWRSGRRGSGSICRKSAAALAVILVLASAGTVHAQTLDGTYSGQAEGVDINGTVLHQLTKWTFANGSLTKFREIITFPGSDGIVACTFNPSTNAPFPYSTGGPQTATPIIVVSFGCPHPSTNERPEAIVIFPEDGGKQFSYLEFNPFSTQVFDQDPPAHFSGQAISR